MLRSIMRRLVKALLPKRVVDALRVLRGSPTEQAVFGMTAFQEQTYYAECARQLQDSEGALVDLGCWMGSTCLSLARGLGDSSPDKIHAFDECVGGFAVIQIIPLGDGDIGHGGSLGLMASVAPGSILHHAGARWNFGYWLIFGIRTGG